MTNSTDLKQSTILEKSFNKKLIPHLRKQVKPTLRLSTEAKGDPLPDGWLSQLRELITRTGRWEKMTTSSIEQFVSIPAIGVEFDPSIIGNFKPKFSSVGFGGISFANGFYCSWNTCDGQEIGCSEDESSCDNNWCTDQDCDGYDCDSNICGDQDCSTLDCDGHWAFLKDFIGELEANWEHPFVQELAQYFKVEIASDLCKSVSFYIGRNMFDVSAL